MHQPTHLHHRIQKTKTRTVQLSSHLESDILILSYTDTFMKNVSFLLTLNPNVYTYIKTLVF